MNKIIKSKTLAMLLALSMTLSCIPFTVLAEEDVPSIDVTVDDEDDDDEDIVENDEIVDDEIVDNDDANKSDDETEEPTENVPPRRFASPVMLNLTGELVSNFDEFEAAVDDDAVSVIVLTGNITFTDNITIDRDLTITAKDNEFYKFNFNSKVLTVENGAALTITGIGTDEDAADAVLRDEKASSIILHVNNGAEFVITDNSKVVIENNVAGNLVAIGNTEPALVIEDGSSLTIKNNQARTCIGALSSANQSTAVIKLDDSELIVENNRNTIVDDNSVKGANGITGVTIDAANSTVESNNNGSHGMSVRLVLDNSDVSAKDNEYSGINAYSFKAINGSTITTSNNVKTDYSSAWGTAGDFTLAATTADDYILEDSTLDAEDITYFTDDAKKSGNSIEIDGDSEIIVDDTIVADTAGTYNYNEDYKMLVDKNAGAVIGNKSYSDLKAALADANDGDVIILQKKYELDDDLIIGRSVTITGYIETKTNKSDILVNLNGHKLSIDFDKTVEFTGNTAKHIIAGNKTYSDEIKMYGSSKLLLNNNHTNTVVWGVTIDMNNASIVSSDNAGNGLTANIIAQRNSSIVSTNNKGGHGFTGSLDLDQSSIEVTGNAGNGITVENLNLKNDSKVTATGNELSIDSIYVNSADFVLNGNPGVTYELDNSSIVADSIAQGSKTANAPAYDNKIELNDSSISVGGATISTDGEYKLSGTTGNFYDGNGTEPTNSYVLVNGLASDYTFVQAVENATDGDVITILEKVVLTDNLEIDKKITISGFNGDKANDKMIDLNGHLLTISVREVVLENNTAKHLIAGATGYNDNILIKEDGYLKVINNDASINIWAVTITMDVYSLLQVSNNNGNGLNAIIYGEKAWIAVNNNIGGHGFTGELHLDNGSSITAKNNSYSGITAEVIELSGNSSILAESNDDGSYPATGASAIADLVLKSDNSSDYNLVNSTIDVGTIKLQNDSADVTIGTDATSKITVNGMLVNGPIKNILALTLNPAGGSVRNSSAPVNATFAFGETISDVATRDGYNFVGWYDGNDEVTVAMIDGQTLTAKWTKGSVTPDPKPTPEPTPEPDTTRRTSGGGSSVTRYTVSATSGNGGSITGSKNVASGGSATFKIVPDAGYEILDVLVDGVSVGPVSTYTFKNVKAKSTIHATFVRVSESNAGNTIAGFDSNSTSYVAPSLFADVNRNDWFYSAVETVVANGLFAGTSETTFEPSTQMTRAMFVRVLQNTANNAGMNTSGYSLNFTDVETGLWYYDSVAWAAANGIVNGYSDTQFAPNDSVTREQMAVLLVKYAEFAGIELFSDRNLTFNDADSISSWAQDSVEKAAAAGLINGYEDGSFKGQGTATRAEVASVFKNLLDNYIN